MTPAPVTLLAILGVIATAIAAAADAWPRRPIRAIVPVSAGSATDVTARLVLDQLSAQLGQPILVDNRTGAGGTIGTAAVAKSDPDGYTILVFSSAHTISPAVYPNLPYDTVRDFASVIPLGASPNVLVVSSSRGIKSLHELVAAAKAKPGSFTFASAGVGTNTHLSAERFRMSAGFEAVHVPFKGGPEAITEVMSGRVDFFFAPVSIVRSQINEGKLVGLAVNSPKRASALPEVLTTLEAGFANSDYPIWFGMFVPVKVHREIVDKLHRETSKALQMPKVREKLTTLGVDPMPMTPDEFDEHVKKEIALNASLVQAAGIKSN
jgi:tripartite-type tricarboxylate transporter receptor subunit TctC